MHEDYFSYDWINDTNYYPQSIKAFTAALLCPFPNLMNYLTFLRNALAFLRIASLKITEKYLCIVVTLCSLSCFLRSHTLTRELSMVLREGSLRNTTMGVFTKLYIDMQNTAWHHGIQDLKWSYSIHHTSTRMLGNSPPTRGSVSAVVGLRNSSRPLLLHESGSMIGCTCQPLALSSPPVYI